MKTTEKIKEFKDIKDSLYVSVLNFIRTYQYLIITAFLLNLTGCADLVHSYGEMADAQDPCQMKYKPPGHVRPDWCMYGKGYQSPLRVYSPDNRHIATVR